MKKKLILISGSPCVGKTAVGTRLFESYDNSAYLDGDWCWCVHPFSVTDSRLRNGDRSMSFVLSNYLNSGFAYVFFTSVVLTDLQIREGILKGITAREYETIAFTLTCSEETLKNATTSGATKAKQIITGCTCRPSRGILSLTQIIRVSGMLPKK